MGRGAVGEGGSVWSSAQQGFQSLYAGYLRSVLRRSPER